MPAFRFLLRTLLGLALILNGSGYALAATQMQMEHLRHSQSHETEPRIAMYTHMEMAPGTGHDCQPVSAGSTQSDKPTSGQPDCCSDSVCACAGIQQLTAAPALPFLSAIRPEAGRIPGPLHLGHASPLVAHLLRPPIG